MTTAEYLSPNQAGRLYPGGLSGSTVRRWCQAGHIPGAFTTPGGQWRIPATWITDQAQKAS